MELFINKMRRLKGIRKMVVIEEAWKAIASANMADYIRYLYKTVRKFYGEAVVVTQEVEDIISSPIVKESIINNSDCKILLDQRKYLNKFDQIQTLLGLTDKEKGQILSVNMSNDPTRKYKEVWFGLGGVQSAVYATETSLEEYLCYIPLLHHRRERESGGAAHGGEARRQHRAGHQAAGRGEKERKERMNLWNMQRCSRSTASAGGGKAGASRPRSECTAKGIRTASPSPTAGEPC